MRIAERAWDPARWDALLERIRKLASADRRLTAVNEALCAILLHANLETVLPALADCPAINVLRLVATALDEQWSRAVTAEETLMRRLSVASLARGLTTLMIARLSVACDFQVAPICHATLRRETTPVDRWEEIEAFHEVLQRLAGWRIGHSRRRRFAEALRQATNRDQVELQACCQTVADLLKMTSEVGISVLKSEPFLDALDRLRETRTVIQLRAEHSPDKQSARRAVDVDIHLLVTLDTLGLIAFERDAVHVWFSADWTRVVRDLEEMLEDTELPAEFDAAAESLITRPDFSLSHVLRREEFQDHESVDFTDHVGLRTPADSLLNLERRRQFSGNQSRAENSVISFWGCIPYKDQSSIEFDHVHRRLRNSDGDVVKYPEDFRGRFRVSDATLPLSAYEQWFLEDLAADVGVQVSVHNGRAATRAAFLEQAGSSATILHVSTHGEAFASNWELSNLYLAADPHFPERVTAYDVLSRDWSNLDLVILNTCLSGAGRQTAGDGLLSLGWAFLAAGVRHAIATRWQVRDRVAYRFATCFYQRLLGENLSIASAFIEAKRALRHETEGVSFHDWAAFILLQA